MDQSVNPIRPPEAPAQNKVEAQGAMHSIESAAELLPSGETHLGGPSQGPAPSVPINTQLPQPISQPAQTQQPVVTSDAPLIAADDEVIEQEWVQKAKSIVAQTKGNPYSQEREIGKLQAEYIKKRYGKEIKLTSD